MHDTGIAGQLMNGIAMTLTQGNYHVTDVSPWGFPMSVHADIEPGKGPTFDDPGYGPEVCISSVFVAGVDIYRMLDNDQLTRIEDAIIRALDL